MYLNVNNPVNYQLQGFGQNGVRTISTDQLYIQGEYYRVLVAEEDSYVTAVSVLGDDLTAEFVYAGTTIYGLFTEVSVTSGSLTAYIAGPTDIEDVWAYINAYGEANAARIEAADCAKDAIAPLLDKYYAKASLVMVPSLYKTSIVYSERPLTTDGQLAFTRSNDTATRVGPDGYIEKVRTNLALYSEDFTNANWVKTSVTVTANTTSNPNGLTTADTIAESAVANNFRINGSNISITSGITYTASVFLKKGDGATAPNIMQLTFAGLQFGTSQYANFNINTGTIGAIGTGAVATIENYGSGWYRCSIKASATATNASSIGLIVSFTNNNDALGRLPSYTGVATSNVFAWGAQLETGDIATDYIPTTTAAVSVGPVANLPRLNYPINSDGSVGCPSLLLEPQRTNTATFSESFDNAGWVKLNTTVTANAATSPDGYANADKIIESTANDAHAIRNAQTYSSGVTYTNSCFLKADTRSVGWVAFGGNNLGLPSLDYRRGIFDLSSGTIVAAPTGGSAKIEDYGNGWYRCSVTISVVTGGSANLDIYIADPSDPTNNIYTGDGVSGLFAWGAQVEVGAYATSYIPTLGAAVTRGVDSCIKTGISSLIGQTLCLLK
jgi:hypothetical protein